VAHAEASAKTVDAAVTAAAAQLGLRSDQVDIEVLEDPVPSTFGYIGTPARVRVTPRSGSAPDTPGTLSATAPPAAGATAGVGTADVGPAGATTGSEAGASTSTAEASGLAASGPTATAADDQAASDALGASSAPPSESAQAATSAPSSALAGTSAPAAIPTPGGASAPADAPVPGDVSTPAPDSIAPATSPSTSLRDPAVTTPAGASTAASDSTPPSHAASDPASLSGSASALTSDPAPTLGPGPASSAPSTATQGVNDSNRTSPSNTPGSSAPSVAGAGTGLGTGSGGGEASAGFGVGSGAGSADANSVVDPGVGMDTSEEPTSSIGTSGAATVAASPTAQPSSTTAPGGNGDRASEVEATRGSPSPPGSESPSTTRPPRRTYRDEPIEPEMVEADTERAGDFLEGLLDALDVDGDITTWVDEVGGHIDLEGTDLDVLVGSNGETLDALQELTRLAVLRQSKRRVRLLLDINGFRARQRERLVTIVKATAEQVIRTREDHEFQPMSPAERKIVHDAVAAIDGARTESLGEDPHRRVVIRPT
jgi:spoIIIJ-associated protein